LRRVSSKSARRDQHREAKGVQTEKKHLRENGR
jgi:hypothetical protein